MLKCLSKLALSLLVALTLTTLAKAETEITYWDFIKPGDGSPRGNALQQIIEKFHAANPDIKVNVQVVAPNLIDPNLIQGAAAGKTPDVARVHIFFLGKHVGAGSIQPIDGYMKDVDQNDWLLPWQTTMVNGKKYALPYEYRFFALMYRKDILVKAGLQLPTTWSEMCATAGKINSPQVMGYAFGLGHGEAHYAILEWFQDMMLGAAGGKELFDGKGGLNFNNAAGLNFFQTIADLTGKCHASGQAVVNFTYQPMTAGLASGTIAMANIGTHRFVSTRALGAGDNLAWSPPVRFENDKPAPVYVNGWTLVMGSKSKHPQEAAKFMAFLTSPDTQVLLAKAGEMPTRKSTYKDPWFQTPDADVVNAWAKYIASNGHVGVYPEFWFDFGQPLADAAQSVVLSGVTPKAALEATVKAYNDLKK